MPAIVRPGRLTSFTDLVRNNPRGGIPADRLDEQIKNLVDAIHSTQQALADIRRDDGKLKNASVGPEQLATVLRHDRTEIDTIEQNIIKTAAAVSSVAGQIVNTTRDVDLRAKDAETAAFSALRSSSAIGKFEITALDASSDAENAADRAEYAATQSQNSSNYSHAQADNAIAAKNEATQWAEYLAGPVVNPADAPAYIADHPFGHGLYYQPVEGYGGTGGLWSAKWWAIHAQQLVGPWSLYYLGGWSEPPVPGSINPDTGLSVPSPIPPGSFYYDTDSSTVFFWNGSAWKSPYALAAGVTSRFAYVATAGQLNYSGPDSNGSTPTVGASPSDVHLNGVKLVPVSDYSVNAGTSTLTLTIPVTAGSIVQWDLLVPPDKLAPGAVNSFKVILTPATPNGTTTLFTMQYTNPSTGIQAVNVTDGAQLQVSVDGIIQEPGLDYVGGGANLTFSVAPSSTSRIWAVWFANAVLLS